MRRFALVFCLLLGCPEETPSTSVLVRLDAEPALRSDIVTVRIQVNGDRVGGGDPTDDLDARIAVRAGRWPLGTLIAPKENETGRRFDYRATALGEDDTFLGRIEVSAAFVDGEAIVVDLEFTADCATMTCDESCEARGGVSQCVDAMRDLVGSGVDAGQDAGQDAAMTPDARPDTGGPPTVELRSPANGEYTGSTVQPTLRWEAFSGAGEYRVQILDCRGVEPLETCVFPDTPELRLIDQRTTDTTYTPDPLGVDTAPPVGARYRWRVAACMDGECEHWSEPRYLNVGRIRGDFNGDGVGDVAIGDDEAGATEPELTDVGAVTIYYGRDGRFGEADAALRPNPLTENARFGTALAAGDFDGDGFADLAIGSTLDDGTVTVHRGTMSGLRDGGVTVATATGLGPAVTSVGDVDADGFDDLVVAGTGPELSILRGGPDISALARTSLSARAGPLLPHAIGDVDGDGFVDLLVGVNGGVDDSGEVVLFRSAPSGTILSATGEVVGHPDTTAPGAVESGFGFAACGGDFDDDGFADVAVGAPNWMGGVGRVYFTQGSRAGLAGEWVWRDASTRGRFGHAVRAADLDGNGHDDLVVGAPTQGSAAEAGSVYVFSSDDSAVLRDERVEIPAPVETRQRFGHAIALTNSDTDAEIELFLTSPEFRRAHRYETPISTRVIMLPGVDPPVRHGWSVAP